MSGTSIAYEIELSTAPPCLVSHSPVVLKTKLTPTYAKSSSIVCRSAQPVASCSTKHAQPDAMPSSI